MSLPTEWPGVVVTGILPCANCGGQGRVLYIHVNQHRRDKDGNVYFYVKCLNGMCRSRSGMFVLSCHDPITSKKGLEVQQIAIDAWNKRSYYNENEPVVLKDMCL